MAHMQVPVNHPGGVYPGAGKEPCVTNPRHGSGQNEIRPSYETTSPKHGAQRSPNPRLKRLRKGPID